MLLHEITLDATKMNSSDKLLGSGIQGVALKTNKPNQIRKVYGLDDLQDPYYLFLKIIQHHQDNPFFPRIYKHKIYKNKAISVSRISKYAMTGVALMEKLHPLFGGKIPPEVIRAMFENLGVNVDDYDNIGNTFRFRTDIERIIKDTTNEKFAEALTILISSGRNRFDLHANNWMVRLTSVGPQLVILDPVYGSDINELPDAIVKQLDFELEF
jgi:hypothetical protein